jgi:hypothetical protein
MITNTTDTNFVCSNGYHSPISFQWTMSLLACIGIPGNILKLDDAQKKVSSSTTCIQLGSGCAPGRIGLVITVALWATPEPAKDSNASTNALMGKEDIAAERIRDDILYVGCQSSSELVRYVC